MKLLDLNVLIYAVNRDSPVHARARTWLESVLSGDESVGLPWVVVLGFLRVTTNRHVLPMPLTPEQAIAVVDSWFTQPSVVALGPMDSHWPKLREYLLASGTAGNLTTDAHLATLAVEHDAELCSTDGDFSRFAGLRLINPLGAGA
jgi:toxin-antitoxin system PIN domain toxin